MKVFLVLSPSKNTTIRSHTYESKGQPIPRLKEVICFEDQEYVVNKVKYDFEKDSCMVCAIIKK